MRTGEHELDGDGVDPDDRYTNDVLDERYRRLFLDFSIDQRRSQCRYIVGMIRWRMTEADLPRRAVLKETTDADH